MNLKQFLAIGLVVWIAALAAPADAQAPPVLNSTLLNVTQPLGDLPGVTPDSTPNQITTAIQKRFDYLDARNTDGQVFLPAGVWNINKPIFMTGTGKELVGDGIDKTILHSAPGYAFPMVNVCVRSYQNERPIQTTNRWLLTGANRVLDASVAGPVYGIRTYGEYPNPDTSGGDLGTGNRPPTHITVPTPDRAPDWQVGKAYNVNDIVHLNPANAVRGIDAVCLKANTASNDNQPYSGPNWKDYWVLRIPFTLQFLGDPINAGPFDPALNRATNWGGVKQFTLDFAFILNGPSSIFGTRPLVGAVTNNCFAPSGRSWLVSLQDGKRLNFSLSLSDGAARSFTISNQCTSAGTYRLAVQVDFVGHTIQAWLKRPEDADFTRTLDDTTSLPANSTFQPLEYGYLSVAGSVDGGAAQGNGNVDPPLDMIVCGLHESDVLRYADSDTLKIRGANTPTNDQFRYFTNDHGTIAFLPLTDHPAAADMTTSGRLITVQHGDAAGDANVKGYGYLQLPGATMGIGRQRISDMSIITGPTWGCGLVSWNLIDSRFWNLDVHGGYYGLADLSMGAQYTFDIRHCNFSGSEAGYNGMSNISYLRDVTFNPVGRCGMLITGSNMVLDHVAFTDPTTFKSEYYYRHLATALYGGMNTLDHVLCLAPAGCQYPSVAAITMANQGSVRMSMIIDDCHITNMGHRAAFLQFDPQASLGHGSLVVTNSAYAGSPISSFIRAESPWWSGPIIGINRDTPVKKWVDQISIPGIAPWQPNVIYGPAALVEHNGKQYLSASQQTSTAATEPGTPGGVNQWRPAVSNFAFTWK